ncbi:proline-rich protein 5-like isoform X6 [Anolis carolinensis]|uniref:proline-rich protein 5-like isoform X6 n=1 Tax=Anolis carolinensis TaxID=28377 RepID=UPI0007DB78D9|nr:PREDICTED: proline-rich protein 5-like isoform X7 [Anolis carolinensis]|eukprot:XP_016848068.1 PREDICTED: proline-rich protein 5-like isoform X7 [Anolis carolinensis]
MTRDSTTAPVLLFHFQKMGSFRRPRPRFMSSPVLSDLPRFLAARQSLQFSSNSAWNSVQTAVINVFKGGGLQNNELYTLNENVRRLLKSELGPFITDYFQNQLLAKGLLFIEEKVKLSEGENRIHVLSEIWDHFFTETLPTLQAIFYPVQGQELTVRQIALLGFRDLVLLKVKMDEFLPRVQNNLPPSIVQMLLILQGFSLCCRESMSQQVPVRPICSWRSLLNWLCLHTLVCVKNTAIQTVPVPWQFLMDCITTMCYGRSVGC